MSQKPLDYFKFVRVLEAIADMENKIHWCHLSHLESVKDAIAVLRGAVEAAKNKESMQGERT
jgi:hypothetical protein